MACNSVAVTSSQLAKVILSKEDMRLLVAQLLGLDKKQTASVATWDNSYWVYGTYNVSDSINVEVRQSKANGDVSMTINGDSIYERSKVEALQKELDPKLAAALTTAQTSSVLRRLAELGKLSNIQQKGSGVVARLEISI